MDSQLFGTRAMVQLLGNTVGLGSDLVLAEAFVLPPALSSRR